MNRIFDYIKSRPIALVSLIVIFILYFVMFFAEFFAPYDPNTSFENCSFHPANIELSFTSGTKGIRAREMRILDLVTFRYAKVKGLDHKVSFFAKGEEYRLFGLIKCNRHLFSSVADEQTGEVYPVFLLGADDRGRDLFSRIVYGSRISLTIGFVASFISLLLAMILGGLAGYYGGTTDWAIMRFSEFFMLIPGLYLILFLRSLLGTNTQMDPGQIYMLITVILSLVGWPGSARTLRGMIHAIKREEFVQDAALEGVPGIVIIFRHIIPQITSLLIVSTTLSIPGFIMSETTLSYLGLGIADPAVSWGALINRNISTLSNLKNFPWLLIPVLLLLLVTLAFNFVGDALRDYFDPYHKGKSLSPTRSLKSASIPHSPRGDSLQTACGAVCQPLVAPKTPCLLSVQDLHVSFRIRRGNKNILVQSVRGVSFEMQRGEILGIVGESGSGKTVTTTAIPGLHAENAAVTGKIWYSAGTDTPLEFTDITSLSQRELRQYRGKKIGMIFQEPGRSFDPLQSMESVFFETFRNSDPLITKEDSHKKAAALLTEVGLSDPENRLKNFPHQFSGGQLQRIGIALSLAQGCELLIADEPTTALDVTIQAQIIELLKTLNKTRDLSIIFISHNINLVAELCENIIVMYGGIIMDRLKASKIRQMLETAEPAKGISPYTNALVASMPRFGTHYTTQKLVSIPGRVTDPAYPEPGCPFAPRCSFAKESCRRNLSEMRAEDSEFCYIKKGLENE